MRSYSHFINGHEVNGSRSPTLPVINPSTGHSLGSLPLAGNAEVDLAVNAAKKALSSWSETPPAVRAKILFRWRHLIEENQEEIATAICEEHGKSKTEALGSIGRGVDVLEFACGIPSALKGEFSTNVGRAVDSYSIRQPVGVVGAITPFNFPAMIPLWICSVAIACGNTVVLKPSERTPSAALMLAKLALQAGLPAGVFNVIHGAKEAVNGLLTHPEINAISFVGQTSTAKYVQQTAIAHGKRVQAFGGAKNHALVMPDADIDSTVDAILGAAYGSAGERCMAISVIVAVGQQTADRLIVKLSPKIKDLKIGAPTDATAEMGPLISQDQLTRVTSYLEQGEKEGAKLIIDGRKHACPKTGFFLAGSLFDHVQPSMTIYQDEIFGPVLCVVRVSSYVEGLNLINGHPYANGVAIFTSDGDSARDFCQRVQVGMVGVNVSIPVPVGFHSFGGWKNSVFADHGMHGMEGVRFFTQLKTITSRWPSGIRQGVEFSLPRVE
ncbi:CoA-acylating methylmalonate-semialdehyde dehydrogenase [Candidatus Odyssella thessalonicensis]|uniref:CoA-acylating methylmalonate-semialdehyde dehydrogenase n=1 Tax=Candidatus Odyssella thessalonicensis TaxID=84647 RepID=UPI0004984C12|nr:CoA-acylating methylmalonate-semialdehyde dehydrogenase [Candidatus Odyssella thessalonicensis]